MGKQQTILEVLITARDEMRAGVGSASSSIDRLANAATKGSIGMAALGTAAIATTVALFKNAQSVAAEVESLDKMAKTLNSSTQFLQGMQHAARMADVDIGRFESGLNKYVDSISEAAAGNEEAAKSFRALGLNAGELAKMDLEGQVHAFADAISKQANSTDRLRLTNDLWGRKMATEVLPLLGDGSARVRELTAESEKLGTTFNESLIVKGLAIDNVLDSWTEGMKGLWNWARSAGVEVLVVSERLAGMVGYATPLLDAIAKAQREKDEQDLTGGGPFGVFSGVMGEQQAMIQNQVARNPLNPISGEMSQFLPSTLDQLSKMQDMTKPFENLNGTLKEITEGTLPGFHEKWAGLTMQVETTGTRMQEALGGAAAVLTDGLAVAFANAATYNQKFLENAKQAWKSFQAFVLAAIAKILLRLLAVSIITSLLPGGSALNFKKAFSAISGVGLGDLTGGVEPAGRAVMGPTRRSAMDVNVNVETLVPMNRQQQVALGRYIGAVLQGAG